MSSDPRPDRDRERDEAPEQLTRHRGLATWGERLVPLGEFRVAAAGSGRQLAEGERATERQRFLAAPPDGAPVEGPFERIAVFGGVYANSYALTALLEDATRRGAQALYCLGDLGGFGPHPERIWDLLAAAGVRTIQGNYEESLASGREDCNCGYTDPRDNHFAALSFAYTAANCSPRFKRWMGELPQRRRVRVGDRELLLVHGSPRRINEFLFESTSPLPFLEVMVRQQKCDGFLCTHTGLPWHRRLPGGGDVVNVGVIGRPANDGRTEVRYAMLEGHGRGLEVELVPLAYDHRGLCADMEREDLPPEFIETIRTGWWTTCLEILPARERRASRF